MSDTKEALDALKASFENEVTRNKVWQKKHDDDAAVFRADIIEKIKPFQEFAVSVSWGWKILIALSGLVLAVAKGIVWVKDHIK